MRTVHSVQFASTAAWHGDFLMSPPSLTLNRPPVVVLEALMRNCSPRITGKTFQQRLRVAAQDHFVSLVLQDHKNKHWCGITLTMKQAIRNHRGMTKITHEIARSEIAALLRHVDRRVYKNAFRRHGKQLARLCVVETDQNGRLHVHLLLQLPDRFIKEPERFFAILENRWNRSDWSMRERHLEVVGGSAQATQWTRYIVKDYATDEDAVDLDNTVL